ncbi:MAG: methyltransferase domain-containing protein [Desulfovibrio sp.]|nr:methyltransferase domain-containing protein [Desulfovibrio sp.]
MNKSSILFLKQFLKTPLAIGSLCPSGHALAHTLANLAASENRGGFFIDLGTGTGVVTRELLSLGVKPENILAIDSCETFKCAFRSYYPQVKFLIADARNLRNIVSGFGNLAPIRAVISSLPLKNMPDDSIATIMREIWKILHDSGGALIQFTYAVWTRASLSRYGFNLLSRRYVVNNLPPCIVEKYAPVNVN